MSESNKAKKLEELALEYRQSKEELEKARKQYDKISGELEKEGIIPARLMPEQKEAKTFEGIAKADPDLYELNNEYATFVRGKEDLGKLNLAAFRLNKNGQFMFAGLTYSASFDISKAWTYRRGSNEAEWFQEKLELARRYNKTLEEKK